MITLVTITSFAQAEGPARGAERKPHLRERVRADILIPKSSGKSDQVQYSQDDLEQTRSALLELAGAVKDLTGLAPGYFDAGPLDDATKQISEVSYQHLAVLRKGLNPSKVSAKLAGLRASIADYKGSIQGQSTQGKSTRQNVKRVGIAAAAPDDDFPARNPFCKDPNGAQYTTRIPVAVMLGVDVTYFIAETVRDLAQDACNEVAAGFNARAACIATDTVYVIAHALWEAIHFCNEEFTDATVDAIYDRLDDIHTDLLESVTNDNANTTSIINNDNANTTSIINNDNANTTSIINNDNANTTSIINNDNANTTTIINNANANLATTINELRALGCDIIRLLNTPDGQRSSDIASCAGKPGWPYSWNGKKSTTPVTTANIRTPDATETFSNQRGQDGVPILPLVGTVTMERNLLESRLIPTYYLPANRGGMIEQVKTLVWNTIEAQLDLNIAKNETTLAKAAAQQADELLAKKKYLEAYRQYCLAYQQLIPAN
jgi:hypothetical protein